MLFMNKCIGTVARMGGVPTLFQEFHDSFVDMVIYNQQYLCSTGQYVHYPRAPRVSIHDVARNIIVESMRGDWLLMLDTDHSFEPDLVARLITLAEKTDADVVIGVYQYRQAPHSPVLYRFLDNGLRPLGNWDDSVTAMEIDSAGGGCLWAKRSVYDRIENELNEKPFSRVGDMGEDHSFFLRLRKLNIKVVWSPQIECHHLQVRPLTLKDYRREDVELNDPASIKGYR